MIKCKGKQTLEQRTRSSENYERNQKQVCLNYFYFRQGLLPLQHWVCAHKERRQNRDNYTRKTPWAETAEVLVHIFSGYVPEGPRQPKFESTPFCPKRSGPTSSQTFCVCQNPIFFLEEEQCSLSGLNLINGNGFFCPLNFQWSSS